MTFGIVVDSAHDLPKALIKNEGIEVVPTKVIIDNMEYRDYYDLNSEEFVKLINQGHYPTTSQPSPADYYEAFELLSKKYNEILAFSISSKLSGTYQTMLMTAKEFMEFEDVNITAFDTLSVSMGSGLQVITAVHLKKHDYTMNDAVPIITQVRDSIKASILFYSLEYLRRGGRISRAKEVLGKIMNAKPIIEIIDGHLIPTKKARGWENGIHKIMNDLIKYSKTKKSPLFVLAHFDAKEGIQIAHTHLENEFHSSLKNIPIHQTIIGPTLLSHAGPKVFGAGVTFIPEFLKQDLLP